MIHRARIIAIAQASLLPPPLSLSPSLSLSLNPSVPPLSTLNADFPRACVRESGRCSRLPPRVATRFRGSCVTLCERTGNTDRIFELLLRVLLILQDPRRDLICMPGYALAPGEPTRVRALCTRVRSDGEREKREAVRGSGGGRGARARARTRANISLCGRPAAATASVG